MCVCLWKWMKIQSRHSVAISNDNNLLKYFRLFYSAGLCCFTIVFRLAPRTIVLNVCARALLYVCKFTRVYVCVCMCASVYLNWFFIGLLMPSIKLRAFLLSSLLIYGQIAKVEKFINQLPNGRECYYQHSVLAAGVGEGTRAVRNSWPKSIRFLVQCTYYFCMYFLGVFKYTIINSCRATREYRKILQKETKNSVGKVQTWAWRRGWAA